MPGIAGLHELDHDQAKIGWDQILKGRFSKLWNLQSTLASQQLQQTNWTVEVADCIYQHWWDLWEIWNQDRHRRDRLTQAQASTSQAHWELQLLYETYQPIAPQNLQWLFNINVEMRKQWSTTKLWQWLHTWRPALYDLANPQWAPTTKRTTPSKQSSKRDSIHLWRARYLHHSSFSIHPTQ